MSEDPQPHASGLPDGLPTWVAQQRWYGAKGTEPMLERIGGWSLDLSPEDLGDVRIVTHYILDRGIDRTTLYQVPLTERTVPLDGVASMGTVRDRHVYDAPHDPAYAAAILGLIVSEDEVGGARGHRQPGTPALAITDSAVLRGEQSNTSIICQVADGSPVMLKIFRALHHGDNPDVVLQSAIAASGSLLVPTSIGFLSGEWPDGGRPDGIARGQLAFAQEFLPGAEDAWRVALAAARGGEDFSARARTLGAATAEVHATLAAVLPSQEPSAADITAIVSGMRARLDLALREVPTLEAQRAAVEAVFAAAAKAPWPALQRIHGDYHLGQVLDVPGRGWVLVDFEGEPMRSMAERSQPDVTLRDVAGMLRSFDYAAGSVALEGNADAAEWASSARHAFLDGYIGRSGVDVRAHRELLDAFEIDKALYEAVYEARNRPDWIAIPVAAARRLAERSATA